MRLIQSAPRRLVGFAALAALLSGCGGGTTLVGAGSTLLAPLAAKWSSGYRQHADVTVTYGSIGSGGGVAQITGRTVDFGASDAPLSPDEAAACRDCVQIPWALAATLVSYHVEGVSNRLKLSGPVLAGIFLGTVERWNHPAIAELNPGLDLPATPITPVYRSDGSGDTYAFTDFLAKVSPEWKRKEGVSTQSNFPAGVGGRGNQGVAAEIERTDGAIGYLGISYVFSNHLDYALVRNAAGNFPPPGVPSISAAAASVKSVPPNKPVSITNPPASATGGYPISTFSYAIVPKSSGKAKALRDFLMYAIGEGQKFAPSLQFAPLPRPVREADRRTIAQIR